MGHTGKEKLLKGLPLTLVSYTHVCMAHKWQHAAPSFTPHISTHLGSHAEQANASAEGLCLLNGFVKQKWKDRPLQSSVSLIHYAVALSGLINFILILYLVFTVVTCTGQRKTCLLFELFNAYLCQLDTLLSLLSKHGDFSLFLDKYSPTTLYKNWNRCCHALLHLDVIHQVPLCIRVFTQSHTGFLHIDMKK